MKSQVGPPVLDLAPFFENESGHGVCERRSAVLEEMNKAAREWGLFQVINHGVDSTLLNEALQNAKDFFALPWEEKLELKRDHPMIGFVYDGMRGEEDMFFKGVKASVDVKQHYFFAMEDHPISVDNAWPQSLPNFRHKTKELGRQAEKLGDLLMTMLSQGLGLSEGALRGAFKETCHHYCLARYPAAMTDDQVLALPKHQDCTCFTMVAHLNQVDGFQTLKDGESDEWLTVEAEKDALIVNIADTLHVLTNGKFKSATHRVVLSKKERIVLLYIYSPGVEEEIAPLPAEANEPPRYRPFKYGELYQLKRAKNITTEHYAI